VRLAKTAFVCSTSPERTNGTANCTSTNIKVGLTKMPDQRSGKKRLVSQFTFAEDRGGMKTNDVADALGISKQCVCNTERYAIRKLWRQSVLLSRIKDRFEKENLV
jgi:DNA-directed RNA polymerase specialized sigma subunit